MIFRLNKIAIDLPKPRAPSPNAAATVQELKEMMSWMENGKRSR